MAVVNFNYGLWIERYPEFASVSSSLAQQYWNEDLGQTIPTFYVISGRDKCHISSSAIRAINKFK